MLERLVGKENLLDVFLKLMEGDLAPQVADGEAEVCPLSKHFLVITPNLGIS